MDGSVDFYRNWYNYQQAYAKYSSFNVGDESTKYTLSVSGYTGTAGESL